MTENKHSFLRLFLEDTITKAMHELGFDDDTDENVQIERGGNLVWASHDGVLIRIFGREYRDSTAFDLLFKLAIADDRFEVPTDD